MELNTITARPAAGPLTPTHELLMPPTTMPPTMPAIIPENSGAPLASAIPRQSGTATKNTTTLAGKSCLIFFQNTNQCEGDFISDFQYLIFNAGLGGSQFCQRVFKSIYIRHHRIIFHGHVQVIYDSIMNVVHPAVQIRA